VGACEHLLVEGNRIVFLLVLLAPVFVTNCPLFLQAGFEIFDVFQVALVGI
jgi:hypothetical protein